MQTVETANKHNCRSDSQKKGSSATRRQFMAAIDNALDAIVGIDQDSKIMDWNAQAEKCFGWSKSEALGKKIHELIIPSDRRKYYLQGVQRYFSTGEESVLNRRIQQPALKKDGSQIDVEMSITPVMIDGERNFYAFLRDITIDKRRGQHLATLHEIFNALVDCPKDQLIHQILKLVADGLGYRICNFWQPDDQQDLVLKEYYIAGDEKKYSAFIKESKKYKMKKGMGGPGVAWEKLSPSWASDLSRKKDFLRQEVARKAGINSALWLPIYSKKQLYGVFEFMDERTNNIDIELTYTYSSLSYIVGQYFDRQDAIEKLSRKNEQVQLLADLSSTLASLPEDMEIKEVLQACVSLVVPRFADWSVIHIFEGYRPQVNAATHATPEGMRWVTALYERFPTQKLPLEVFELLERGQALYMPCVKDEELKSYSRNAMHYSLLKRIINQSGILSPLIVKDRLIGYISFFSEKSDDSGLRESDTAFANEISRRVAQIIHSRRLYLQSQKAESNLRLVINAIPAMIAYVNSEERYVYTNKTFDQWAEVRNVGEKRLSLKSVVPAEIYSKAKAYIDAALSGEHLNYRETLVLPSGEEKIMQTMLIPDISTHGEVLGFIYLGIDITGIETAKAEAEKANRAKSEFLANMSHEIRTPLGAILGFSELLADESQAPKDKQRWTQKIKANGDHLLQLINDILDLSKIESGKIELCEKKFSLPNTIKDIIGMFEAACKQKKLSLEFEVRGDIPTQIVADEMKLRQILINIIGNAVKFTEVGKINVIISYGEDKEHELKVRVKDTGPGMSDEVSKEIFKPFVQADSSSVRRHGGTGLGLSLSRALAKKMGGTVKLAYTRLNEGTEFIISLMVRPSGDTKYVDRISFEKQKSNQLMLEKPLAGFKVLIVEDSPEMQLLISTFLKRAGAEVTTADNGVEGVKKALAFDQDAVLMDIQMPILDGHAATQRLRDAGYKKPIIALTAHALREEVKKSLDAGCNAHITKPVTSEVLISTLVDVSRKKSLH